MKSKISVLILFINFISYSQNLVVNGSITNSNVNWNGQEAPFNAGTYESAYLAGGCNTNYVMETDNASSPQQVVSNFLSGQEYVLSFRCAYRTSCAPAVNPLTVQFQFTDATGVLTYTFSIPNTQTTLTLRTFTFTNNAATTHTLRITNPGNGATCGAIIDDISIIPNTSPGAASASDLSFWLKAANINQANSTNVYCWTSQGINALPLIPPCANPPVYFTGLATAANILRANHNPYLTFNGTNQYLQYINARVDLYENISAGEGGTFFAIYQGGGNNLTYFGSRCANNSRTWARTNNYNYPNGAGAGTNNQSSYAQGARNNLVSIAGKSNGLTVRDLNGNNLPVSNNSADIDYLTVGVRRNGAGTYSEFYNSSLSEIIIFNTILNIGEMQQVRSYLASKYGVTLSDNTNTAAIDERTYLNSLGAAYWDYSTNSGYHNNITVIGRDNVSQLNQRRSISTDADAGTFAGNAMLIVDNNAAISNDVSYFATGHNGIAATGGANFVDVPPGIQSRLLRFWKFQKSGTGIANSIQVNFDMTGFTPLVGTDLRLLVSTTPSFAGASVIAGSYTAPYFTANLPTTGGVYFTVASINAMTTPLPVELINFSATPNDNKVYLQWSTAAELKSDFFVVERSTDAVNFEEIGTKKAAGNSNSEKNYELIDESPLDGVSYYRLKLIDIDKTIHEYNIVSVSFERGKGEVKFSLYPNPNNGNFIVDFSGIENNHEVQLSMTDSQGKEIYASTFYSQNISNNKIEMNLSERLSKGTYVFSLTSEGIKHSLKVLIN